MQARRQPAAPAGQALLLRKSSQAGKWAAPAGLDPKEDAWRARRLATGGDWMEEWISRPGRR